MDDKDMFITMEVRSEADVKWLPGAKPDREYGKSDFIDLTGKTTPEEADTLLRVLISYNDSCNKLDREAPKEQLLRQIYHQMDKYRILVPGGIHFTGDGKHIYPGRGSGMEEWLLTAGELMERREIDMGFEPNVMFKEKDGDCYVISLDRFEYYADSGMGSLEIEATTPKIGVEEALQNEKVTVIRYQAEEFDRLLEKLDRDFQEFLDGPLQKRMDEIAGDYAEQFCGAFDRCFRSKKYRRGCIIFLGEEKHDG